MPATTASQATANRTPIWRSPCSQQGGGDTCAACPIGDEQLLELVVTHGDEAHHAVGVGGDGRRFDPGRHAEPERRQRPIGHDRLRDVTEVAVAPGGVPDRGDRLDVGVGCGAKQDVGHGTMLAWECRGHLPR